MMCFPPLQIKSLETPGGRELNAAKTLEQLSTLESFGLGEKGLRES